MSEPKSEPMPRPKHAATPVLPRRVVALIRANDAESERLIGWLQLGLVATFALLYAVSPRPADAGMALAPVPIALSIYAAFTTLRLWLSHRDRLPAWLLGVSIAADIALLLGLIWSFHPQYGQSPALSLKAPTFVYILVFVALRALRFDARFVLATGLAAAAGWALLVAFAVAGSPEGAITRNFVDYIRGDGILLGAEFDKIFAILMVTAILAVAVARARRTLIVAVREETAGREVRRFLSLGLADAIAHSETLVVAGTAVERDAAILMLDIRGFTRFSATVSPQQVVAMLTGFHALIVPLIRGNGGVVDKFLGDGVMATFGAVMPSQTAAADALRTLDAVMLASAKWTAALPAGTVSDDAVAGPLEVNGAVAAGRVVFATLGNEDRLEYTVIGDAVNLAAKLEKHNKAEGSRALVSAAAFELALSQGYAPRHTSRWRRGARVAGATAAMDIVIHHA